MIKIRDLCKQFGKHRVLNNLSLDIQKGETLVILGRSGTGKSVLLKHIIGILAPDSGTIVNETPSIQMGMLFQGAALFDSMTVGENAAFFLNEHGDLERGEKFAPDEIESKVTSALGMVGLAGTEHKMPSELSGGMRKRAALARLIVYAPKVLLYDEPTTGLDPITAMQINELIVKTQGELQATSIVVTHDILSALYVADRLALMDEGKIAYIDTPENFLKIDHPIINFLKKTLTHDPLKIREMVPHSIDR